ncbi:MAG: fumarylacetoacetate hydrolase family protein [Actinomycetota bacterium]
MARADDRGATMRLSTVQDGRSTTAAVENGDTWITLPAPDVAALLRTPDWRDIVRASVGSPTARVLERSTSRVLAPVLHPRKIICCGLNYRDHIIETGREVPRYPTLFAKFADTLTAPTAPIEIIGSDRVDWEAELAVIVGAPVRRATRAQAEEAIFGYTVANDISLRDWQSRTLQWFQGKAWDATTPLGPVIVSADEISPRDGLEIRALIDGDVVQQSNTRDLVFDAADLVSYISRFTRLLPGDVILTGTPGGVGMGRQPQRWLADGEVLTTSIEGIGELRNQIRIHSDNENPEETIR